MPAVVEFAWSNHRARDVATVKPVAIAQWSIPWAPETPSLDLVAECIRKNDTRYSM
jgi:hypothetical protein